MLKSDSEMIFLESFQGTHILKKARHLPKDLSFCQEGVGWERNKCLSEPLLWRMFIWFERRTNQLWESLESRILAQFALISVTSNTDPASNDYWVVRPTTERHFESWKEKLFLSFIFTYLPVCLLLFPPLATFVWLFVSTKIFDRFRRHEHQS